MELTIHIKTIPHNQQRYPTVGDYFIDEQGVLQLRVSEMSDPRFTQLVALHELVELLVESMKLGGAPTKAMIEAIDKFDKKYEAARKPDDDESEPGASPNAPYYQGHMLASAVENLAAMLLGVDYNRYADEIAALP